MKLLCFIFTVFFITSFVEENNLSGTYCQSDNYQSTCISFLPNNRFRLSSISSTENAFGLGTYQIENKRLLLNFDKIDSVAGKSKIQLNNLATSDTSRLISLKVKGVDLNNNPIPLLGVKVSPVNSEESYFLNCNLDGTGSLILPKSNKEALLSCITSFYEEYEARISLNHSSEILFQLDNKRSTIMDTIISIKYKKITDSSIVVNSKFIYSKQY